MQTRDYYFRWFEVLGTKNFDDLNESQMKKNTTKQNNHSTRRSMSKYTKKDRSFVVTGVLSPS